MGTSKFRNAPAAEVRRELDDLKLLFRLYLDFFVSEANITAAEHRILQMEQIIKQAPDEIVQKKGVDLISSNQTLKRSILKKLEIKRSWREVCVEFRAKVTSGEFSANGEGVPLLWLFETFGFMARDKAANDLPLHARIGFGHNRRRSGTEEQMLLSDAFMFFRTARQQFEKLKANVETEISKGTTYQEAPETVRNLTYSVCAHARISLFTFCAFAECFVNGVGIDYLLRNPGIAPQLEATLRGQKANGGFLSLEAKIEKYPLIIAPSNPTRITLRDPKQIREPFKTFLDLAKPTRDSIAHHAEGKARIWYGPKDWMELAERAARATIIACQEFWKACYPERDFPVYLSRLDFDVLCQQADARITIDPKLAAK